MTKRMLIDATHAEETRVVVLDGNRLEDFDVETSTKRQLKGNIYLAKVVRVEPSLQAAFVEYGGNRHGFLAFDEIHPDYYQIPVADRERLLAMQAEQVRREEEAEAERDEQSDDAAGDQGRVDAGEVTNRLAVPEEPEWDTAGASKVEPDIAPDIAPDIVSEPKSAELQVDRAPAGVPTIADTGDESGATADLLTGPTAAAAWTSGEPAGADADAAPGLDPHAGGDADGDADPDADADSGFDRIPELPPPETVGGEHDTVEEARERRIPPRFLRNYKIQEVIRRRQILLVQVVKEERGTKGAALTTYISLAGRYCVLMPNSPRGGGISRKITSAADRRRLKEVTAELDLPDGMGLIVRTAGANRPKPEIKRDCEYLLRLWDDIREHTMRSVAPALIYEEASLIKRAIRDVYSRDIDEITVDGEAGWRAARDFMRMLMPSHVKKVQLWRDAGSSALTSGVNASGGGQPLFSRHQVDVQLDAVLSPTVQLRSGGYLVINQAEALVAIDVNSGRSTRERGIEETALRTNLEAADEVARQLRLRDLAGLIVIDFIDMESKKHNAMVERRLKDALKTDRARIQVGHISHFGLLEMSRQRLRPSLAETSFVMCERCGGTGHVRSTESAAIHVLRGIEEEAARHRAAEVLVHAATAIEMYIFNHKRERLAEIETRYALRVAFAADDALISPQFRIERLRAQITPEAPVAITAGPDHARPTLAEPEEAIDDAPEAIPEEAAGPVASAVGEEAGLPPVEHDSTGVEASVAESAGEAERHRRRRRRRRRGGRRDDAPANSEAPATPTDADMPEAHLEGVPEHVDSAAADDDGARRRGRRGRRRRRDGETLPEIAAPGAEQPELIHAGPTPANPFGSHGFDIFDVLEQAEQRSISSPAPALPAVATLPPAGSVPAESVPEVEPEPAGFGDAAPEPLATPAIAAALPATDALPDLQPEPPDVAINPRPAPPAPSAVEPEPLPAANDREPEPAIHPIVIGVEDEPVAEKKRGWWRG